MDCCDYQREHMAMAKDLTVMRVELENVKTHHRYDLGQFRKCEDENKRLTLEVERLREYVAHTNDCILSFLEAGEPTKDGGYRTKYKGVWYQSKPINEEPKCDCGLEEALSKPEKAGA